MRHGARDPQVRAPVGHLGELAAYLIGVRERLIDVPEWTRSTHSREVKVGGRLSLGDVARTVHAHEDKGHAARVGALEGAETMRDGLVSHLEAVLQQLNVVAELFCRVQELPVRQDQRPGEVVGHANSGQ